MDVVSMVNKIPIIANTVIRKSSLPDFSCATEYGSESMGVSALYELNGVFECYVLSRSQQDVYVLGHENEGVKLIPSLAAIAIQSL